MNPVRKLLKLVAAVLLLDVFAVIALFSYLSIKEYKPADKEAVEITENGAADIDAEDADVSGTLSVLTWNIGYAGLSETADFFMDGGDGVRSQDKASVQNNLDAMLSEVRSAEPDILFLQEIDRNSSRSFPIDEPALMREETGYLNSAFANNLKVSFLPYPIPPIGKVDSGIMTLTNMPVSEAERIQLPIPFSWPVRMANLKRCLLVERIPLTGTKNDDGSEKELVLVNLHLEAYDDGSGKIEQTKMLADLMQEEYDTGNYVIAGGDFNQTFSGTDTSMYPLQSSDLWACGLLDESSFSGDFSFLMDNSAPTCRSLDRPFDSDDSRFQFYLIDGFIVSNNIEVETLRTLDKGFVNSDHNPVYMTFSLKDLNNSER